VRRRGSPRQLLHEVPGQGAVGRTPAAQLDDRRIGVRRQGRQAVQPADDVHQRGLHVGFQAELHVDERAAVEGVGLHDLQSRQSLEYLFHRFQDFRLDLLGGSGPPACLYVELRQVDIGKKLHGQPVEAEQAEQRDDGDGHGDAGRVPDCPLGDLHLIFCHPQGVPGELLLSLASGTAWKAPDIWQVRRLSVGIGCDFSHGLRRGERQQRRAEPDQLKWRSLSL
jgi:hypothetical protein